MPIKSMQRTIQEHLRLACKVRINATIEPWMFLWQRSSSNRVFSPTPPYKITYYYLSNAVRPLHCAVVIRPGAADSAVGPISMCPGAFPGPLTCGCLQAFLPVGQCPASHLHLTRPPLPLCRMLLAFGRAHPVAPAGVERSSDSTFALSFLVYHTMPCWREDTP